MESYYADEDLLLRSCRICCSKITFPDFLTTHITPGSALAGQIFRLLEIEVLQNDKLPNKICFSCLSPIKDLEKLKITAQKSMLVFNKELLKPKKLEIQIAKKCLESGVELKNGGIENENVALSDDSLKCKYICEQFHSKSPLITTAPVEESEASKINDDDDDRVEESATSEIDDEDDIKLIYESSSESEADLPPPPKKERIEQNKSQTKKVSDNSFPTTLKLLPGEFFHFGIQPRVLLRRMKESEIKKYINRK